MESAKTSNHSNNKKRKAMESAKTSNHSNNKKRSRSETEPRSQSSTSKKGKAKIEYYETDSSSFVVPPDADVTDRPLSIFEFPWQKDNGGRMFGAGDFDCGCDLRDVFFSSLVDGGKAAIGVPGDRLWPPSPSTISLPSDWEAGCESTDGVDCIWSCVLREPILLR